ncbi:MAG: choice-of-anchor E domain-containing protein [Sedimentisphaeraceae bacterium JB056]
MKVKMLYLAMAMLIVAPFAANALTITQNDTFSGETLDFSHTSTFNRFDTMGGTRVLNSVTFYLEFSVDSGGFIADNDAETTANISFEYAVNADLTSADVFGVTGTGVSISDNVALELAADDGDGSGVIDSNPSDGVIVNPSTSTFMDSQVVNSSLHFSYIGTDTFDTILDSGRTFNITGSSGVEGGYTNMTGSGEITVVYDYSVVPEPASLAILGLGGLLIRRRKK